MILFYLIPFFILISTHLIDRTVQKRRFIKAAKSALIRHRETLQRLKD